jgi:hypothetical protein
LLQPQLNHLQCAENEEREKAWPHWEEKRTENALETFYVTTEDETVFYWESS